MKFFAIKSNCVLVLTTHRHSRVFNSSSVLGQGLTLAWFLFVFTEYAIVELYALKLAFCHQSWRAIMVYIPFEELSEVGNGNDLPVSSHGH